jgi:hypothetical protein
LELTCGNRRVGPGWISGDAEPGYPAAVHLGHGDRVPADLHLIAHGRDLAQDGEDVACHGLVRAFGELDPGLLGELIQV